MRDEGDLNDLPTVVAYFPITRRKFMHYADGPDGRRLFAAQRLTDVIEQMDEAGWREYRLVSDGGTFLVRVIREN